MKDETQQWLDYPVDIKEDDIDSIDSIYMPARYPIGSALPFFEPNQAICQQGLQIAERVRHWAEAILREPEPSALEGQTEPPEHQADTED